MYSRRTWIVVLGFLWAWLVPNALVGVEEPVVAGYAPQPVPVQTSPFSVTVNGDIPLLVEQEDVLSVCRCRLTRGPATLSIAISLAGSEPPGTSYEVFPKRLGLRTVLSPDHRQLRFTLDAALTTEPRQYLVRMGQRYLALFIDLPETDSPGPGDPNVRDVREFLGHRAATPLQTEDLQAAIDATQQLVGDTLPTLVFPPGLYRCGTLHVRGSLRIHLADGARLQGSDDQADYSGALLDVEGHQGMTFHLTGRGEIAGNGRALWERGHHRKTKLVHVRACDHVVIRDVLLRDASNWTCYVQDAQHVEVDNVKVVSPGHHLWNDAFDVTSCTDYRNSHSFSWSVDDATAIMARGAPCDGVVFSDFLGHSECSGSRIGWNSSSAIRNVVFRDCEWSGAGMNAIAFHQLQQQATYGNIRFERCRFDRRALTKFLAVFGDNFGPGVFTADGLEFTGCTWE